MPSRTGTASQVDGSGGSGSTSVTVPVDATMAVALWSCFDTPAITMSSLTLGGNAFTIQTQIANVTTVGSEKSGVGVAILENLPGTGAQTFAWNWSNAGALDEGGGIFLVWVKDHNRGDAVRGTATDAGTGSANVLNIPTTDVDDLLLALAMSFNFGGSNPALDGSVFVNNALIGGDSYDVSQVTPGSPTTTINMTGEDYSAMVSISLKVASPLISRSQRSRNPKPILRRPVGRR